MFELLILAGAVGSPPVDSALAACRPALERKAQGRIASIDVEAVRVTGSWVVIRGPLTAFIGMAPPALGSASTHHLIRAQYQYICWVRAGRVRRAVVDPLQ